MKVVNELVKVVEAVEAATISTWRGARMKQCSNLINGWEWHACRNLGFKVLYYNNTDEIMNYEISSNSRSCNTFRMINYQLDTIRGHILWFKVVLWWIINQRWLIIEIWRHVTICVYFCNSPVVLVHTNLL